MQVAYSMDVIPATHQASTVVTFERAVFKRFEEIVPKLAFFTVL
jgi:hypothetical protein